MNMKTGLLGLGLFVVAGAVTISCGGSDGDSDETGGSSGTTAGSSTGGSNGGSSSTAGSSNNGGSNSNGGSSNNNGGTNSNGGTNNNNQGGEGPAAGGAGSSECPATEPMDGAECSLMGFQPPCVYGDVACTCRGRNNRTWNCDTVNGAGGAGPDFGFGGAGPDIPQADSCPANAMTGDDCTGQGQCPGQQCFCANGNVFCFGG